MSEETAMESLNQNKDNIDWKDTLNFICHTLIWIIYSYLIPIINIVIIMLVNDIIKDKIPAILSIVLATNTCFIMAIITTFKNVQKNRDKCKDLITFILILSSVCFTILTLILEMNINNSRITEFSFWVSIFIFFISCIFGFIGKKDEWDENREVRVSKKSIKKAKTTVEGAVNGVNIKI
jgi:uncharacterized membrane protein